MNDRTLDQSMRDLITAQLVTEESAEQFSFRHALTHEAVYHTLLVRERRRIHHLVAETVERLFAATLDVYAAELAHHYFEAGTWQKALIYSRQAGERARQMYAPREAAAYFTRALESARQLAAEGVPGLPAREPPLAALHRARGQVYETLGNFEHAHADYDATLRLARRAADRQAEWQVLLDLGFLWAARDYQQSGAYFERALELARALGDPATLAHTLNRVGNWYGQIGQLGPALEHHQEALAIFNACMDRHGVAETLDLMGLLYLQTGDWFQSASYYERAIGLFRELGDRRGLSSALANYAQRAVFLVDVTSAPPATIAQTIAEAAEALQVAQEIGWRSGEAFALVFQALVLGASGEFRQAFDAVRRGMDIVREIEHQQWLAMAYTIQSWLYRDVLALEEALQCAEKGLSLAQEVGSRLLIKLTGATIASVRLLQNDWPGVERVIAVAWQRTPEPNPAGGGSQDLRPAVHAAGSRKPAAAPEPALNSMERWLVAIQGELALARGDPALALQLAEQLIALALGTSGQRAVTAPVLLVMLRAEALVKLVPPPPAVELEAARQALQAARDDARARGARSTLWHIHLALGNFYQAQGAPPAAETEFAAARALIDQLAASVPAELRHQFLERAQAQIPPPPARA